ncbi:hypothetical protein B0I35DRAFT_478801 [Stachybotrys elegans]|uniref:Copper acquisition factor BIM1-like domain-containing protein n=1 Tax=Stachybotrys elegans TaxID=80388 RepID=A0A8K0WSA1_9HYPO|nr:hypothetical protein B0I35DRAFT_478801 [Stachybotrys elegans]
MASLKHLVMGVAYAAVHVSAQGTADDIGPAAFMWPEDRVWSGDADNHGPCGSVAEPHNRTEFPMQNGQVALVAQDDSYDVILSIAYNNDPQSNSDFETLISARAMRELDPGHTCLDIPDAPSSVSPGDLATLQIQYIAQFDNPNNETFYACADIVWVQLADFDGSVPCFNATEPDAGNPDWYHDGDFPSDNDDDDEEDSPDGSSGSGSSGGSSSGSGLSRGAIAGIAVGSIAGVGLIAGAAFYIYRRRQQRLLALRQQHSSRGVSWEAQPGKKSASSDSVRMQNL